MDYENLQQTQKTSGYGKRPVWQWVLIYVVVGGLVYFAIYYFAIARKGGYNAQNANYNYNYNASGSNYNYNYNYNTNSASNRNTTTTSNANTSGASGTLPENSNTNGVSANTNQYVY